jgi:hypothetical protein
MRRAPRGVHRERVGDCRPALWYVIWLGEPHAEGSVILGRSKRLEAHLMHRFFPEAAGTAAREIRGWVNGAQWLLEVYMAGPTDPREYGDERWAGGDAALEEAGYAAGLDVWDQVTKAYENYLGDGGLANAQLWSLRQAVLGEHAPPG